MPHPASPHLPAAEISGGLQQQEDQDLLYTEFPFRTPTFPRPCGDPLAISTAQAIAPSEDNHTQQPSMIPDPGTMQWSAQDLYTSDSPSQDAAPFYMPTFLPDSSHNDYPQQAQGGMSYDANHNLDYPLDFTPSCPRVYNGIDFTGLRNDISASYPPASFFHSPPHIYSTPSLPDTSSAEFMQLGDDYDLHYFKHEDQLDHTSPYWDISRASTPYSTGLEEDDPIDKEQPYAQLIYRALLTAPNHTMVLRDIYDWFKTYTDKAAHSETKGWQNSIRHNLSMNGAFEKVDSPADATTKGFMWRLTPAALREGVKSTTRYRSKAPNKRSSTRTQPLPQRQASGAKGGHAARRAAHLRRSQRARELNYHTPPQGSVPRSEPHPSFTSEWEDSTSSSRPPRADTPYTQTPFAPYHASEPTAPFSPILGLPSHFLSPPHGHAHAAYRDHAPGEPLFSGSPTPSADEPITPTDARTRGWQHDMPMGAEVYDLSQYGAV